MRGLQAQELNVSDPQVVKLTSESLAIRVVDPTRVIVAAQSGVIVFTRPAPNGEWVFAEHPWVWRGHAPRIGESATNLAKVRFLFEQADPTIAVLLVLGTEPDGSTSLIRVDEAGVELERIACGSGLDQPRLVPNADHTMLLVRDRRSRGVIVEMKDGRVLTQPLPDRIQDHEMSNVRLHVTPEGEPYLLWQDNAMIRWCNLQDPARDGQQRVTGWTNHIAPQLAETSSSVPILSVVTYGNFPGAKVYDFITNDGQPRLELSTRTTGGGSDELLEVVSETRTWMATVSINAAPSAPGPGLAWVRGSVGLRLASATGTEYRVVARLNDDGGVRAITHGGLGMNVVDSHAVIATAFGTCVTVIDVQVALGEDLGP